MSAQQPQPSKYSNFYSGVRTVSGLSTGPIKSPKTSIFLPFSLSCFHYWQGVRDLWKLVPDKGFDIKAGVRNNNISYIEWVGVYPVSAKAYFKKFCQLLSECGSGIYGYFPGVLLLLILLLQQGPTGRIIWWYGREGGMPRDVPGFNLGVSRNAGHIFLSSFLKYNTQFAGKDM